MKHDLASLRQQLIDLENALSGYALEAASARTYYSRIFALNAAKTLRRQRGNLRRQIATAEKNLPK